MSRRLRRRPFFPILCVLLLLIVAPPSWSTEPESRADQAGPLNHLLATAYPVGEVLHYDVTWMGMTAGRLTMEVRQLDKRGEIFAIDITARSAGLLGAIYPVRDEFRVIVQGDERLPSNYRTNQRQGERLTVRNTTYDQQSGRIVYQRDLEEPRRFQVDGPVHNEFSAFYITRIMPLALGNSVVIPAFADNERHQVRVVVERLEEIDSILGRREAMRIRPHLNFAGLYEKVADPQIWLTNDHYRVPLLVKSRIAIGSLTATLSHYEGPLNLQLSALADGSLLQQ
ncbi:MAG: DUF3108 domain-containing protein [Desulfurivibrio sp.]